MATKPKPSTSPEIDEALKTLMKRIKPNADGSLPVPEDVCVKIVALAISWQKVLHQITDKDTGKYNPENL